MPSKLFQYALVIFCVAVVGCSSEDPSAFPNSDASYDKLNSEVGCDSKYSDDKKDDIFNSKFKSHWMTWSGELVLAEADNVSLNIDGKGTQDLHVDFADKQAGYNLTKGNVITVKFLMKNAGGCFLPFSGDNASIVSANASPIKETQSNIEQAIKQVDTAMQDPSNRCGKKYASNSDMHEEFMEKLAADSSYENGADRYFSAFVSDLCVGILDDAKQYVSNAQIPIKSAQFIAQYFEIKVEFEEPSAQSKQIESIRQELTSLGICQACAGNAAMYGVIKPNSECGNLVKNALNGDEDAMRKLEEFPAFCEWKL